eukprot:TRINITY_DN35727_c0_g1_i1.p2 TRINITY_DN35727_c0_g1~~TRINITY_DN35727_c0_g1_i1.p2  ORF type:complete len:150 (+),score=57.05 TRINITY_DN35727_c0_g1_i1:115-564(+)
MSEGEESEDDISGDEQGEEQEEEVEEDGDGELDEDEIEEDEEEVAGTTLTGKMVDKWRTAIMEQRSVRALRSLVMAFESGCHVTDAVKNKSLHQSFEIANSAVFDQLMQSCVSDMDSMLDSVLGIHCCTKDGNPSKDCLLYTSPSPRDS